MKYRYILIWLMDENYLNRWIKREEPQAGPLRSPNFNLLDYFYYVYLLDYFLKTLAYKTPVQSEKFSEMKHLNPVPLLNKHI